MPKQTSKRSQDLTYKHKIQEEYGINPELIVLPDLEDKHLVAAAWVKQQKEGHIGEWENKHLYMHHCIDQLIGLNPLTGKPFSRRAHKYNGRKFAARMTIHQDELLALFNGDHTYNNSRKRPNTTENPFYRIQTKPPHRGCHVWVRKLYKKGGPRVGELSLSGGQPRFGPGQFQTTGNWWEPRPTTMARRFIWRATYHTDPPPNIRMQKTCHQYCVNPEHMKKPPMTIG